jgi:hypothetical protein
MVLPEIQALRVPLVLQVQVVRKASLVLLVQRELLVPQALSGLPEQRVQTELTEWTVLPALRVQPVPMELME